MLPEYWADSAFRVPVSRAQASKGTLLLRNIPGKEWIYAQHWTLGRLEKDHFVTMNHTGLVFEKETLELLLPVGIYRLIAVKRLLNGDQEAAELLFAIEKEKQTELYMPDFEKTDGVMPWEKNSVPDESQSCRKLQTKQQSPGGNTKLPASGHPLTESRWNALQSGKAGKRKTQYSGIPGNWGRADRACAE